MGRTIVWVAFGDFIVILAWECNHVISSVAKLHGCLKRWTTAACLLSFQKHRWVFGRVKSYHTKGKIEKLHPVHKGTAPSKQKPTNRNKMRWRNTFPYFNHNENGPAVLISVGAVFANSSAQIGIRTVGLRRYHYYDHYHLRSNPLQSPEFISPFTLRFCAQRYNKSD